MSVTLASCSKPDEENNHFDEMDSKTFFETETIPEKLSIDINLDEIKNFDKATTYQADYLEFDKQKLVDALITGSIVEEKVWAEGPQVIASAANIRETLNINDGGKAFGGENGMEGGFSYSKSVEEISREKLDIVANAYFQDTDEDYTLNSDYASYSDLEFSSYEEALTDIKNILTKAGMPQLEIDETYSLDLDTMMSHYELYLNNDLAEEEYKNFNWSKDDEAYIFSMQQLVDNIPIVNKPWQMPDGTKSSVWGNPMEPTTLSLVYDKTGIREISAYNILNIKSEIESSSLINLYEALHTLIEAYSLTILEDDIRITSAELCYLSIPKGDAVELIPGWVFRSTKPETIDGQTYSEYKYDVVNAVTGKLYQDRW